MVVICVTVAMQNLLSFQLDVFEVKLDESEKADSDQETNQGHLAFAASALSLRYDNRTMTSPHNSQYILHCTGGTEVPQSHTRQPLSMCRQKSTSGVNQKIILSIKRDSL